MEEIYELSESEDDFSFSLLSDNESENTFDRSDMECSSDETDIIGHKRCRVLFSHHRVVLRVNPSLQMIGWIFLR